MSDCSECTWFEMFIATLCRAVSFVLGVVPFDLYQQLLNLRYLRRQSNCRRLELYKSCVNDLIIAPSIFWIIPYNLLISKTQWTDMRISCAGNAKSAAIS